MKYKINLITKRKEKAVDKVIYFVMNYLRYILVITQIVVIGVFFYNLKLIRRWWTCKKLCNKKRNYLGIPAIN